MKDFVAIFAAPWRADHVPGGKKCRLRATPVANPVLGRRVSVATVQGTEWLPAGTFEALHRAGNLVAKTGANKLDAPRGAAGAKTRRKR